MYLFEFAEVAGINADHLNDSWLNRKLTRKGVHKKGMIEDRTVNARNS